VGMGVVAAELVLDRLDGDKSKARRSLVPTRLIVRGSGEVPAPQ
jgi:LacI family transcriptional regulator